MEIFEKTDRTEFNIQSNSSSFKKDKVRKWLRHIISNDILYDYAWRELTGGRITYMINTNIVCRAKIQKLETANNRIKTTEWDG
jgi:hypothetical protein